MNNQQSIIVICVIVLLLVIYYIIKKNRGKNNNNGQFDEPSSLPNPFEETDEIVEPNNPFYTSKMVVLNNPNTKYENVKNKYLVKKNMEYMKLEDDEVNKHLLPHGTLFVGP